ncbi:hypothetical protein B0I35DRAFT_494947, partial [Stachybotrys elegans]
MSWLHRGKPSISVLVTPYCGYRVCETLLRREIESELEEIFSVVSGGTGKSTKVMGYQCQVCGKMEGIKRCGGYKAIGYCGIKHQKADWKVHKKRC